MVEIGEIRERRSNGLQDFGEGFVVNSPVSSDDSRWQLDFSQFFDDLKVRWQGLSIDGEGNLVRIGKPLMNSVGVERVLGILATVLNHHVVLSNLDKNRVKQISFDVGIHVLDDLIDNYEEYGIELDTIEDLTVLLSDLAEAVLERARNGREAEIRAPNVQRIEQKVVEKSLDKDSGGSWFF